MKNEVAKPVVITLAIVAVAVVVGVGWYLFTRDTAPVTGIATTSRRDAFQMRASGKDK